MEPTSLRQRQAKRRERMDRRAIAGSLLVHLGILLVLLLNNPFAPEDKPAQVLRVTLLAEGGEAGAAGGLAGSSSSSRQHEPDMTSTTAPPETAPAAPAGTTEEAIETAEAEAEPVPETKLQIEAPRAVAPVPLVVPTKPREPPLPKPLAKQVVKPVPKPTPKPPTQTARIEPSPLPPVEPMPAEPRPRAPTMPLAAPPAPNPGRTATKSDGGPGPATSGTTAGPDDDYLEQIRRWVAMYKKYPADSLMRKEEGHVMATFVLARDGTVLSAEIERSSGFPLIDQAVLDMLRNASPVPPVPAHYAGERLSISMPVNFKLGFFERLF